MARRLTGTVSIQELQENINMWKAQRAFTQRSVHFVHIVILQCALKRIRGLFSPFGWSSNLLKHTILYLRNNMLHLANIPVPLNPQLLLQHLSFKGKILEMRLILLWGMFSKCLKHRYPFSFLYLECVVHLPNPSVNPAQVDQGSVNFYCKGPGSKHPEFCRPYDSCCNYSALQL